MNKLILNYREVNLAGFERGWVAVFDAWAEGEAQGAGRRPFARRAVRRAISYTDGRS